MITLKQTVLIENQTQEIHNSFKTWMTARANLENWDSIQYDDVAFTVILTKYSTRINWLEI